MKKIFLPILLFTATVAFSQDLPKLELNRDGVQPIVVNIDSFTVQTLYKKSLNWVQENNKNPKEVLKTDIENETIRIAGLKNNACYYKSLGIKMSYDLEYLFQIDLKDNKVRLTFIPGQLWNGNQKVLYDYKSFFKNDGEIRSMYKDAKTSMEQSMNDLVFSLYNFIKGKKREW